MMLRLSFNLNDEALAIEKAVEGILEEYELRYKHGF